MRLDELVLDGFKSYAVRTVVAGFDSSFNAITGLNGSGKSNILDAINFVLGLTNFATIRGANLQDLIYKRGQAGVTKASVTAMFINDDRSKSPVGFENQERINVTRSVAIGGTSKYLINGHRATQQQVLNLFQSVQLNINNPNFVIMQGRITKVLNMKPPEILSMIEEASGTSMFEDRKDKAIKTMAKKDKKMEEMAELLRDEINPKLEKLRLEKRAYLEFQQQTTELERLTRICVAYDFVSATHRHERSKETMTDREQRIADSKLAVKRMGTEVERMRKEIDELTKKKEKELAKGGKIQKLDEKVKALGKQLAAVKERLKIRTRQLKDDEARIGQLESSAEGLTATREAKTQALAAMTERYESLVKTHDALADSLAKAEDLFQSLTTGVSGAADSASSGYMGQLAAAKQRVAQLGAEVEQTKVKISHMTRELKDKEPRARQAQGAGSGVAQELEQAKADQARLQNELSSIGGSDGRAQQVQLSETRDTAADAVQQLSRQRDQMRQSLGRLNFDYADPSPNFDRSRVHGLVASQVRLADDRLYAATALEIAAGGRLYNVIVDDEQVGKQLLERGRLQQRVTIIPLNKIQAYRTSADKVAAAKRLAPGKVDLAIDLISHSPKLKAAMEFVFGSTFICADAETAKKVAFAPNVRTRCVTLEGDVYNPSGTLEGGSAPQSTQVIENLQKVAIVEEQLAARRAQLEAAEAAFSQARDSIERYNKARRALEMKTHEVGLLEERMADSSAMRIVAEVAALKESIGTLNATTTDLAQQRKDAEAECKRIEKEMSEFKNNRDSKLDQLKAEIKTKKAEAQKAARTKNSTAQDLGAAKNELADAEQEIEKARQGVIDAREAVVQGKQDLTEVQAEADRLKDDYEEAEFAFREEQRVLSAFDDELGELQRVIEAKEAEIGGADAEQKKLEGELAAASQEVKSTKTFVVKLQKDNPWVLDEQSEFGTSGSAYDFDANDMAELKRQRIELEGTHKAMKKKVNTKVLNMIEDVEKREAKLNKMYKTVETDKKKIHETIQELDKEGRKKISETWEKVNVDFGSIFGELLPGNTARLDIVDGDLKNGLEVKVRLGQTWKQSLTELSGGQRSLIALSLIMSLLQYSPAPMYILDEVDAALDLNHTQNIGHLFRTRFKGSQFIVVSLKEGLFTNANVLFRARFRDGTSVVERTANRTTNSLYDSTGPGAKGGQRRVFS